MIDTLRLSLSDYEVTRQNRLTVQPSPYNAETGQRVSDRLLWHSLTDPRPVFGVKAYCNSERFNLTIRPVGKSYGRGPVGCGCYVQLSVPKFHSGSNVKPVNRAEAGAAMQQLEQELADAGVKINISRAIVTRLDCLRDLVTCEPYSSYQPLFDLLSARRMQERNYGTTYYWQNSQQTFCVYDKRQELMLSGTNCGDLPANLLRIEHRLETGRRVKAVLGLCTVSELLKSYGDLPGHYRQALRENIFRQDIETVKAKAASQLEAVLETFKATERRYWLEHFLIAVSIQGVAASIGLEGFKAMLSRHLDRGNVWRIMRKLERLRFKAETARRQSSGKPLADLYRELRSKALAA